MNWRELLAAIVEMRVIEDIDGEYVNPYVVIVKIINNTYSNLKITKFTSPAAVSPTAETVIRNIIHDLPVYSGGQIVDNYDLLRHLVDSNWKSMKSAPLCRPILVYTASEYAVAKYAVNGWCVGDREVDPLCWREIPKHTGVAVEVIDEKPVDENLLDLVGKMLKYGKDLPDINTKEGQESFARTCKGLLDSLRRV